MCKIIQSESGLISTLNPFDNSSLSHEGLFVLYNETVNLTSIPGNSWLIFNYSGSSWVDDDADDTPKTTEWSATEGDVWSDINVELRSEEGTSMGEILISSIIYYDAL